MRTASDGSGGKAASSGAQAVARQGQSPACFAASCSTKASVACTQPEGRRRLHPVDACPRRQACTRFAGVPWLSSPCAPVIWLALYDSDYAAAASLKQETHAETRHCNLTAFRTETEYLSGLLLGQADGQREAQLGLAELQGPQQVVGRTLHIKRAHVQT